MYQVDLRKLATEVFGTAALEERFAPRGPAAVDVVLAQKLAGMDLELVQVAATFDTGQTSQVYDSLGGNQFRMKE